MAFPASLAAPPRQRQSPRITGATSMGTPLGPGCRWVLAPAAHIAPHEHGLARSGQHHQPALYVCDTHVCVVLKRKGQQQAPDVEVGQGQAASDVDQTWCKHPLPAHACTQGHARTRLHTGKGGRWSRRHPPCCPAKHQRTTRPPTHRPHAAPWPAPPHRQSSPTAPCGPRPRRPRQPAAPQPRPWPAGLGPRG